MKMRLTYLDGLRGLAAVAVLVQHSAEIVIQYGAAPTPFVAVLRIVMINGCNFGRFGVALFFLISGMVIPFSFREPRPIFRFILGRIFRLYPAYWLSIGTALIVFGATDHVLPSVPTLVANLTMLQRFVGRPDLIDAYWTLAVELMFYVCCAGLYATGSLQATRVLVAVTLILLVAALGLAFASLALGRHFPAGTPLNLSLMFVGTLIRRALLDNAQGARGAALAMGILWLLGVAFVQLTTIPAGENAGWAAIPSAFLVGYYLAFAVFVIACLHRPTFGPIVLWLGAVSYSVYLFHGPMLVAFGAVVRSSAPWSGLAFFVLVTSSSLTLAALVWRFVERPAIRAGRLASDRISRVEDRSE